MKKWIIFVLVAVAALKLGKHLVKPPVPETAEAAFQQYTHSVLRNRRHALQNCATKEHIAELEKAWDLSVVAAGWPVNVAILKTATRGEKTAVAVEGLDPHEKKPVKGVFVVGKADGMWKVEDGSWSGWVPDDLDAYLKQQEEYATGEAAQEY